MSMLADLFPPERRTRAFAILAAQAPIGAAIGALVAGFAREALGWRGALMLVGVPGLIFAVVVWRTLREPTRGWFQSGPADPPADLSQTLRFLLGLPAFRHTLVAYTILVTVAGAQSFDAVYLERVFGFAPKEIGTLFFAAGLLSMIGYYLAGWLCDRMTVRDASWALRLPVIFLTFNLTIALVYYQAPNSSVVVALALTVPLLPGVLPIVLATVQNLSPATMRARAAAILLTVSTLVGLGCGAPLAGAISDALTPTYGHAAIRWSLMSIVVTGVLWAMLHFYLGSRTLDARHRGEARPALSAQRKRLKGRVALMFQILAKRAVDRVGVSGKYNAWSNTIVDAHDVRASPGERPHVLPRRPSLAPGDGVDLLGGEDAVVRQNCRIVAGFQARSMQSARGNDRYGRTDRVRYAKPPRWSTRLQQRDPNGQVSHQLAVSNAQGHEHVNA